MGILRVSLPCQNTNPKEKPKIFAFKLGLYTRAKSRDIFCVGARPFHKIPK
jgi:hypothetical protein